MKSRLPLISAWVGRGNFGDELLGYGLRLELYRMAAIERLCYHEAGDQPIYRALDDVAIDVMQHVRDGRLRRWLASFRLQRAAHDTIFFGGGSVLHSEHSIRWKHALLKRFRNSAGAGKGLAAGVGLSLGPFANRAAEQRVRDFIADLDLLICRDASSAAFARSLATPTAIVDGRDLAYGVRCHHPEIFRPSLPRTRVGVSFILNPSLDGGRQAAHLSRMQAIVDLLTDGGHEVLLIALYTAGKYFDDRLADRLQASARHPERVAVHHYRGDVVQTSGCIASCTHLISMRLHGAVTAYLAGVPVLTLNRHPKVVEFARESGVARQEDAVDIDSPMEDIRGRIDALLALPPQGPVCVPADDMRYGNSIEQLRTLIE
ncbi:MAG: polysaccharide pyruvyl transferase family protein [Dechloromonas sp.]|nr:MAG: polysaccharide pyruvyl transferase family protein [Dechloromonas sp.]